MSVFDNIRNVVTGLFPHGKKRKFLQYRHTGKCKVPCNSCGDYYFRIFEKGTEIKVPRHENCDCYYKDVQEMLAGTVSKKGKEGPDYYLKYFGRLPSYYITKKEAEALGWNSRRNTLSGKIPGKMIGGDDYDNKDKIFPIKEGRKWFECDVDYISGPRGSARLIYSNDGLIFFSPDHYTGDIYYIIGENEEGDDE